MSLALATKGIIVQAARGGAYPVYVYVPMEEPDVETGEVGAAEIRAKELKPRIRTESAGG